MEETASPDVFPPIEGTGIELSDRAVVEDTSPKPRIDPSASVKASTIGDYCWIGARTSVHECTIGDYSYVVNDSSLASTTVGRFCSIAAHTRINPGNHPMWRAALHHWTYRSVAYGLGDDDDAEFFNWRREHGVTLGDDVWIGHGAIVLPGVTVGTGAAIGAGAVVTKDVEPFAVVVGVPAKVLRFRFEAPVREALLRIGWWQWSRERLRGALQDFRKLTAEEFVEKYG
jgi:phosphonate metabolism protein (transferase hexapeptide repeat family)